MNCLALRRAVMAAPRHLSDTVREHALTCPECAAFVERTRR